ncbi:transglutaminase family protein [Verticiella sediminum]|uniref:Transglutaminase family protein n=1 Tax=Verticiella sediminum TaxID=1247510 RepID=A0A556A7X2_9BURK|nr:transglutaminase family protein [Verticiella sediminum]TSH88988.1 transglutaminase family protein [Verticiella sediminum]
MQYHIRHVTTYHYTAPVNHSTQVLRLTPREEPHQHVLRWHIAAPGPLHASIDAYGNVTHILSVHRRLDAIELVASGFVDVQPLQDGRLQAQGSLPVQVYCVQTPLTRATPAVLAFCQDVLSQGMNDPDDAMRLTTAIHGAVAYEPGVTDVTTDAERVLELGHGVCQDHAHLFLACARGLGRPARYVSGYLHTTAEHMASHAWVDVWFDAVGWVSIDVTHNQFTNENHCRLAVARDYDSAAPVRGVRRGGGDESMSVSVEVLPHEAAQQQ